ncbi:MAG: recombinase family protein [Nanoarchaeota archaeon]
MKVALYARVSLDESDLADRRFQDLENQFVPLREWANVQGWEVVGEYSDRMSGANPARPGFRNMMKDAMQLRFNAVLVWKLDRFSREGVSQTLAYIERLKRRGVAVKSLTESWLDTSKENPVGELVLSVMSWSASEERRRISERTKAGIKRRRAIGQWKGGRPKGSKDKRPRKRKNTNY